MRWKRSTLSRNNPLQIMKKKALTRAVAELFGTHYHTEPQRMFLSPARINIIGEHVDYNDGFVLPAAINKYVCFAVSEHYGDQCTLVAGDLDDTLLFSISDPVVPSERTWANYLLGVLAQLKERGLPVRGFKMAFASNIPMGAGLSSSAALECGFAYALNELFDLGLSRQDIALIGQRSEHTFVGVKCGIMDQFASVFGKKNHAIRLDCNTLDYDYHSADFGDYTLLLLDSKVKHTHLTSGYNVRRQQVEAGFALLKQRYPGITTFRDLTIEQVDAAQNALNEVIYRRCRFVVREIERVREAVDALDQSDFVRLGALMNATHDGLSRDYEVSCDELDFLVEAVRAEEGVLGARMMGGGFGGCTINLVRKDKQNVLIQRLSTVYKEKFGVALEAYKVKIANGTMACKTPKIA